MFYRVRFEKSGVEKNVNQSFFKHPGLAPKKMTAEGKFKKYNIVVKKSFNGICKYEKAVILQIAEKRKLLPKCNATTKKRVVPPRKQLLMTETEDGSELSDEGFIGFDSAEYDSDSTMKEPKNNLQLPSNQNCKQLMHIIDDQIADSRSQICDEQVAVSAPHSKTTLSTCADGDGTVERQYQDVACSSTSLGCMYTSAKKSQKAIATLAAQKLTTKSTEKNVKSNFPVEGSVKKNKCCEVKQQPVNICKSSNANQTRRNCSKDGTNISHNVHEVISKTSKEVDHVKNMNNRCGKEATRVYEKTTCNEVAMNADVFNLQQPVDTPTIEQQSVNRALQNCDSSVADNCQMHVTAIALDSINVCHGAEEGHSATDISSSVMEARKRVTANKEPQCMKTKCCDVKQQPVNVFNSSNANTTSRKFSKDGTNILSMSKVRCNVEELKSTTTKEVNNVETINDTCAKQATRVSENTSSTEAPIFVDVFNTQQHCDTPIIQQHSVNMALENCDSSVAQNCDLHVTAISFDSNNVNHGAEKRHSANDISSIVVEERKRRRMEVTADDGFCRDDITLSNDTVMETTVEMSTINIQKPNLLDASLVGGCDAAPSSSQDAKSCEESQMLSLQKRAVDYIALLPKSKEGDASNTSLISSMMNTMVLLDVKQLLVNMSTKDNNCDCHMKQKDVCEEECVPSSLNPTCSTSQPLEVKPLQKVAEKRYLGSKLWLPEYRYQRVLEKSHTPRQYAQNLSIAVIGSKKLKEYSRTGKANKANVKREKIPTNINRSLQTAFKAYLQSIKHREKYLELEKFGFYISSKIFNLRKNQSPGYYDEAHADPEDMGPPKVQASILIYKDEDLEQEFYNGKKPSEKKFAQRNTCDEPAAACLEASEDEEDDQVEDSDELFE